MSQLAFEFEPLQERKAASAVPTRTKPLTPEDLSRQLDQHPDFRLPRLLVLLLDHVPAPKDTDVGVQRVLVSVFAPRLSA